MAAKALAAEVSVAEVISRSLHQVAEAQQRQTQIAFDRALSNLGYRVEVAAAQDRTVVLGENGDRRIVALVRRGGRVYTDMEGFQGGECLLEAQRVYEELAKEGIYPRQIDPDFHGRREGGVILTRANRRQRAAGIALAQAVLEESLRSGRQARRPADVRDRRASGKAPRPARRAPANVGEPVAATHASTPTAAQAVVWPFGRQGQRWL
jgi:urease beta subunit